MTDHDSSRRAWPLGDGEMAERIRTHDWAATPIGPLDDWPQSLRTVVDLLLSSPIPMAALWGPELVQIYNDGFRDLMGVKHPAGLGQPTRDCWPERWHIDAPSHDRVRAGEGVLLEEALHPITRSGTLQDAWFTLSYSPLRDDGGAIAGVLVTMVETTGHVLSDRLLQTDEERLAGIFAEAPVGLSELSRDGRFLRVNRALCEMLERSEAELLDLSIADVTYPDDLGPSFEAVERAVRDGGRVSIDKRYRRPDDTLIFTESTVRALRNDGDTRLLVVTADLTERRRIVEALRESEEKYRTLFETMGQGYCELELLRDADGQAVDQLYLELNPAYERLIGISVADAKGRTASQVMPDLDPCWTEAFDRIAKGGEPERIEYQVASLGRWFEVFVYPRGGDRLTVLYEDVTDRKRAEDVLRESGERQAFLLKLGDALRAQPDAEAIGGLAMRMLADELKLDRAYIVQISSAEDRGRIESEYRRPDLEPIGTELRLSDFPEGLAQVTDHTVVAANVADDPSLSDRDRQSLAAIDLTAIVVTAVRRGGGNPIWAVVAGVNEPRAWSAGEIGLVEDAAERTWAAMERARADAALRQSEEKFRALFDSIDEGLAVVEMIYDDHGEIVDMIFRQVNSAYERQGGIRNVVGRSVSDMLPGVESIWLDRYKQVARTGEPLRVEDYQQDVDRWFDVYFSRVDESGRFVAIVFNDISDRKRAEDVLRESEERQAFLLKLSDALRQLSNPEEIRLTAATVLGEHLGASRVAYAENVGDEAFDVTQNYVDGAANVVGRFRYDDFGSDLVSMLQAGKTRVQPDIRNDATLSDAGKAALAELGVGASLNVPLVKNGGLVAFLGVNFRAAHDFQPREIALVEEAAQRTWAAVEQARAEAALRKSETKYRTLFESIDEGFELCELLHDQAGEPVSWRMIEVNPAYERITGLKNGAGKRVEEVAPNFEPSWLERFSRVVRTGQAERFEDYNADTDRWYSGHASRVGGEGSARFALVFDDITERKRQQQQQQYLVELNDALRSLDDSIEIQWVAMCLLGGHLKADRVVYAGVDEEDFVLNDNYVSEGTKKLVGRFPFAAFGGSARKLRNGQTVVVDDVNLGEYDAAEKENFFAVGVHAVLAVPLIKNGRFVVNLSVHQKTPRHWRDDEIALVQETAERTWAAVERAKAEEALRQSEKRLAEELSGTQLLQRLSTRLIPEQPPEILHEQILDAALELMQADAVSIQLLEDDGRQEGGQRLRRLATRNLHPASTEYWTWVDAGHASTCGQALRTNSRVIAEDVETSAELAGTGDLEAFRRSGTRAVQSTPLVSRSGRPIGMISTHWHKPRRLSETDFGLFDILARQVADLLERSQAEAALRASEERQAFLLKLSDALRPLADPAEIMGVTSELVGRHFQVGRCGYAEVPPPHDRLVVERDWTSGAMQSLEGAWPLEIFGEDIIRQYRAGQTVVVKDALADARMRGHEASLEAIGHLQSSIAAQLVKKGEWVASFYVQDTEPRAWSGAEIALIEEIAERTWAAVERARAEEALRQSRERFRQFADASSDGLWIRDAATLDMEYVSPAVGAIYGVERDDLLGDVSRWMARIVSDDREIAAEHLERARYGEEVEHEFRIARGSDGAVRWIRNTDFPLLDDAGRVRRIGGIAEDITDAKEAADRQSVLVSELQHRTRNLIAVVRALSDRTVRTAGSLDDFRDRFEHRLTALSRVQGLLSHLAAGEKIGFDELLTDELRALGGLDGKAERVTLDGPKGVRLRSSTVQTLALALHELATNAAKYGALSPSNGDGHLAIRWHTQPDDGVPLLHVEWRESGVAMPDEGAPPQGGGYGRELIERALPYQLGAQTSYTLEADGVRCTIAVPIARSTGNGG